MVMTSRPTVIGVFEDQTVAERALDELLTAGFDRQQIHFFGQKSTSQGGMMESLKSFFTGETGETTTSANADDFMNLGAPEQDAHYFAQEYQQGRSMVAVQVNNRLQEATDILATHGAYGVPQGTNASSTTATEGQVDQASRRLPLREEQLQVSKQPVKTGEVSIHKEIVTEQQTIDVPVTREEVVIERRPVSGHVSNQPIGESETLRIPVSEEQVQVNKQTVTTGEVAIGKRQVQDTKHISDTVRHEEARLERQGDAQVHSSEDGTLSSQEEGHI